MAFDEMAVLIAGRRFWLWRAVDDEGEVLDLLVQRRRDARAAAKVIGSSGFPAEVVMPNPWRLRRTTRWSVSSVSTAWARNQLQPFAHKLRGRPCVAPSLHEEIENLVLVVARAPEPESSAADQDRHLVEMPLRGWPVTSAAKFLGE
jgi:transposase-like protein